MSVAVPYAAHLMERWKEETDVGGWWWWWRCVLLMPVTIWILNLDCFILLKSLEFCRQCGHKSFCSNSTNKLLPVPLFTCLALLALFHPCWDQLNSPFKYMHNSMPVMRVFPWVGAFPPSILSICHDGARALIDLKWWWRREIYPS